MNRKMLEIRMTDIAGVEADAIVNPANSLATMGGGVAGVLKRAGGVSIEQEAKKKAPIPLGSAVITKAGTLKAKHIIHAPTMEKPTGETSYEIVASAMHAALDRADAHKVKTLAVHGMGTGVGKLNKDKAAAVMVKVIQQFQPLYLQKIILVATDKELFHSLYRAMDTVYGKEPLPKSR